MKSDKLFIDWLSKLSPPAAAVGAASAGILGATLLETGLGSAHVNPGWGHLGQYTYSTSNCSDVGVDPITAVFAGPEVSSDYIEQHAATESHGGWWLSHGSRQYFMDHGVCQPMDDQAADGGSIDDRYHVRWNLGDIAGLAELDSGYGYHAPASPHHEEWVPFFEDPNCFGSFGGNHAVWANNEVPGGGFVSARNRLVALWLAAGDGHYLRGDPHWWGNTEPRQQCDGGLVWSDGWAVTIASQQSGGWGLPRGRGAF